MSEPVDSNPIVGSRAVFIAGFLTGNVCGLVYLGVGGHLWESVSLNPIALIGAFLGIGLVGTLIGGMSGLALKLLLDAQMVTRGWLAAVIIAGLTSGLTGLLITGYLVVELWYDR